MPMSGFKFFFSALHAERWLMTHSTISFLNQTSQGWSSKWPSAGWRGWYSIPRTLTNFQSLIQTQIQFAGGNEPGDFLQPEQHRPISSSTFCVWLGSIQLNLSRDTSVCVVFTTVLESENRVLLLKLMFCSWCLLIN